MTLRSHKKRRTTPAATIPRRRAALAAMLAAALGTAPLAQADDAPPPEKIVTASASTLDGDNSRQHEPRRLDPQSAEPLTAGRTAGDALQWRPSRQFRQAVADAKQAEPAAKLVAHETPAAQPTPAEAPTLINPAPARLAQLDPFNDPFGDATDPVEEPATDPAEDPADPLDPLADPLGDPLAAPLGDDPQPLQPPASDEERPFTPGPAIDQPAQPQPEPGLREPFEFPSIPGDGTSRDGSGRDRLEDECLRAVRDLKNKKLTDIDLSIAVEGEKGVDYPASCVIDEGDFQGRQWMLTNFAWTASGLCHKPLYFEEVALERYGHTVGPIGQPVLSAAHFFLSVPVLPYKMGVHPPNECVYALGYYRPGDCAPYFIPPIPVSARGAVFQAGAVVGVGAILP